MSTPDLSTTGDTRLVTEAFPSPERDRKPFGSRFRHIFSKEVAISKQATWLQLQRTVHGGYICV